MSGCKVDFLFNWIKAIIEYNSPIKAPISKGDKISLLNVYVSDELVKEVDIFADEDIKLKGFIDLVIKTEDGKYHVIDWKTCSWGWDARRKSDSRLDARQIAHLQNIETCHVGQVCFKWQKIGISYIFSVGLLWMTKATNCIFWEKV